jgi:HJR/Mrr/RecB family endonuclease
VKLFSLMRSVQRRSAYRSHRDVLRDVDPMTGREFEIFIGDLLIRIGYKVVTSSKSRGHGADVVATLGEDQWVFQAKVSTGLVGMWEVFLASKAARHYRAGHAVVVTNSRFTDSARQSARTDRVALWDRDELARLIQLAQRQDAKDEPRPRPQT